MVIGARVMQGLMEGAVHPTFYAMAARWLPEGEKASLVSLAMFGEIQKLKSSQEERCPILSFPGMPTGCTLSLMLGGVIAEDPGWEYIFYTFGAGGLAWSVVWCFFMYDSPSKNPRCSIIIRSI